MKKIKVITLLSIAPFLLTSCSKTIDKATFRDYLNEVKEELTTNSEQIGDVHINNKLSVTTYDYKVGEYYSYSFVGLLGIGSERVASWKENGKFYHYHSAPLHRDNKVYEVTEQAFNDYMISHKNTLLLQMMMPVTTSEGLSDQTTPYENGDPRYKKTIKNEYVISSTVTRRVEDGYDGDEPKYKEVKDEYEISFKSKLPLTYSLKSDDNGSTSETKWSYSYGNSKFNAPGGEIVPLER